MSRFSVIDTSLAGLKVVERQRLSDERGFLSRIFCADELVAAGWNRPVSQINHTKTQRSGAVRGLHFQRAPHADAKLVSCVRGAVWDVAVDLRKGSPTFLRWHAEELSIENCRALLIPEGFAHGFQVLSDGAELFYCHGHAYAPQSEGALNVFEPRVGVTWPLAVVELSDRDRSHPMLTDEFDGITP